MHERLKCIMLIDDNPHDNFFHERAIKAYDINEIVVTKDSGASALKYLEARTTPRTDLIFLDINMPGMNAWDFLEAYALLDEDIKSQTIIVMLTTSARCADRDRAEKSALVSDFITKPLTKGKMEIIAAQYFGNKETQID